MIAEQHLAPGAAEHRARRIVAAAPVFLLLRREDAHPRGVVAGVLHHVEAEIEQLIGIARQSRQSRGALLVVGGEADVQCVEVDHLVHRVGREAAGAPGAQQAVGLPADAPQRVGEVRHPHLGHELHADHRQGVVLEEIDGHAVRQRDPLRLRRIEPQRRELQGLDLGVRIDRRLLRGGL